MKIINGSGVKTSQGVYAIAIDVNSGNYKYPSAVVEVDTTGSVGGILVGDVAELELDAAQMTGPIVFESTTAQSKVSVATGMGVDITVPAGKTVNGTIEFGTSSVTVTGLQATSKDVTFSEGSVVIGSDVTIAATGITVNSGTAKVNYNTSAPITVADGATLIVPKDVEASGKIVNNGTIDLSGKLMGDSNENTSTGLIVVNDGSAVVKVATNNGVVSLNEQLVATNVSITGGTVAIAPGMEYTPSESQTIVSNSSIGNSLGLNQNLDTDLEIKSSAFLEKDLVIDEGVTLTVGGNAILDLNGKRLTVLGNLVVKNNGIIQTVTGGTIEIGKTGTIDNKGIIGKGDAVKVCLKDNTSDFVTVEDAVGINFGQTKKVSGETVVYTLCISGDVSKKGTATGTIGIAGSVSVKDSLSIGNGVTLGISDGAVLTVTKNSVLEIGGKGAVVNVDSNEDGTYTGSVSMASGATVIVDGSASTMFTAQTGKYITANGSKSLPVTTVVAKDLKGFTLEVTSASQYDEDAEADMTEQRFVVSGELKDADGKAETEEAKKNMFVVTAAATTANYTGIFIVDTLAIDKGVERLAFDGAKVTVLGTVSYDGAEIPSDIVEDIGVAVIGAVYTVEATDADGVKTTTHYIKSFDEAIGLIDTVKDKTISVYGPVEITGEVVIGADQNVEGDAVYTITKDGKLTVSNDATLDAESIDVKGIMVVQVDGTAPTSDITYNAKSEDKETGDVTYYGFLIALQNAKAGDVIEISKETEVSDSFTVPEGVTVEILSTGSIESEDGKTVNMTVIGTLVNEGTLEISGKTDVRGTMDLTEQTLTTLEKDITVSGEIVTSTKYTGSNMNGVCYQNDDGEYVYTTPSKAVAAVSEMDVGRQVTFVGKVSDSAAIVLDDVDVIIPAGATANLGDVTLAKSKVVIDGTFSGTIIGKTGAEETTGAVTDTTIVLVKAQSMEIESKTTTNAQNVKVWSTTLKTTDDDYDLVGSVEVETGVLTISANMDVDDVESTVTVGTGAGLLVPKGVTLTVTKDVDHPDKALMIVDGDIEVKGTLTVGGIVVVNGTMDVSNDKDNQASTVNVNGKLVITGDLVVGEDDVNGDGSVVVDDEGVIVVGTKPSTLGSTGTITGPIDINNESGAYATGYILVYASGNVSAAKIEWNDAEEKSAAKSTTFNINNQPYMTVYAIDGKVAYYTVLGAADIELVGYSTTGIGSVTGDGKTYWYKDVDLTEGASATGKIGDDDNLFYRASAVDVEFNVSVGFGISLYIDGLNIKNDTVKLSVGTHTVSATVDPGYTGTITIAFNGVTVTDGKIVVTPEMASAAYDGAKVVSATGDITTVAPEVSVEDEEDEGLALTDILLIVLVVLIVIMAVIVALRMMRS